MILKSIEICNYKSVDSLVFEVKPVADSKTYTLLGINEAGKTSILQGMNLINVPKVLVPQDFHDKSKSIRTVYSYELDSSEREAMSNSLTTDYACPPNLVDRLLPTKVNIAVEFAAQTGAKTIQEIPVVTSSIIDELHLNKETDLLESRVLVNHLVLTEVDPKRSELNVDEFLREKFKGQFLGKANKFTFWKASPEYLISDSINLTNFAQNPEGTSKPLANCFRLIGLSNQAIVSEVAGLGDPANVSNLQSKLSEAVTEHIRRIWPEHPISILFVINGNVISCLVEDDGVRFQAKTTGQRSDGFRQFISFLLTLSIESTLGGVQNTVLLIDEPETHLHPQAQINQLSELIAISKGNNNTVLFATHSNYMIDKQTLDRCYSVHKINNKTELHHIAGSAVSYSEVTFSVFDILSTEFHNELYGFIEDADVNLLEGLPKDREWWDERAKKSYMLSLSKFIRHSIHHPENTRNPRFSDAELNESIQILKGLREKLKAT